MNKITFTNRTVSLVLNQTETFVENQVINGLISQDANGEFKFEESLRQHRYPRNPKLYDGRHIVMIRTPNGVYRLYLKNIRATPGTDAARTAEAVSREISEAFRIINA